MKGAKEFYEYCVEHPEKMEQLRAMEPDAMAEEIYKMGYSFTKEEFQAYIEQSDEESDEQLAASVSGGICTGHCGSTCEHDCAWGGASIHTTV